MPDAHPFVSTMRINLPPEVLEQTRQAERPAPAAPSKRPPHPIIRIPARQAASGPIGGAEFQQLLQNIYDGVLIAGADGHIVNANMRATQFFNYPREELCRRNVLDLFSGADEALLGTIWKTLEADQFVLLQAYCNRYDGSMFPAEISVNRLRLSAGDYLSYFVRDITLRKESEDRLRTGYNAIQNSANGIAIADIDALLVFCNPAMLRLWGLPENEPLEGINLRRFLSDPTVADEIIASIRRGASWSREIGMRRTDGEKLTVQLTAAVNMDTEEELTGMVLSVLDISARKEAEHQLERYANELRVKNRQMEEDLVMAREIEQAFLPRGYPVFPPKTPPDQSLVRFGHVYVPSGMVGGDFFDIIAVSSTQAGCFVSDVMGHGMRAALVVATLRGLIEQLLPVAADPGAFLTRLNHAHTVIFRQTGEFMFSTAFYGVIDLENGKLRFANAGHPTPLMLRRGGEAAEFLADASATRGPALGLFEDSLYRCGEVPFDHEDCLVAFTDGVYEALNALGEEFGIERMRESLARHRHDTLGDKLNALVNDVRSFSGSETFDDDVCVVAAKRVTPQT